MTHTLIISSLRTEGTLFFIPWQLLQGKMWEYKSTCFVLYLLDLIPAVHYLDFLKHRRLSQMIAMADFKAALFIFLVFFVVLVVQSSSLHEVLSDPWCIVIAIRISEDYVSRFSGGKAACYHTLFDWVFHETLLYIHRTALPVTHCIAEHVFCVSGSVVSLLCFYFLKINKRAAHLLEVKSLMSHIRLPPSPLEMAGSHIFIFIFPG